MKFEIRNGVLLKCYPKNGETEAIIPEGVTRIDKVAFQYCDQLKRIVILEGMTQLDEDAFSHCRNLQTVILPDTLTRIGDSAFCKCGNLRSITIPENVTEIGSCAFRDCTRLEKLVIPDSVESIGSYAFAWCRSLKEIRLSGNLIHIVDYVFADCLELRRIVIPDGVISIGEYTFFECKSLESVCLPESIFYIGHAAFQGCEKLSRIRLPDSLKRLGRNAFFCRNAQQVIEWGDVVGYIHAKRFGRDAVPDLCAAREMLRSQDYQKEIALEIKYPSILNRYTKKIPDGESVPRKTVHPDALHYLQENFSRYLPTMIQMIDVLEAALKIEGIFRTEKNLREAVEIAGNIFQQGGSPEALAMLLRCQTTHFPASDAAMRL